MTWRDLGKARAKALRHKNAWHASITNKANMVGVEWTRERVVGEAIREVTGLDIGKDFSFSVRWEPLGDLEQKSDVTQLSGRMGLAAVLQTDWRGRWQKQAEQMARCYSSSRERWWLAWIEGGVVMCGGFWLVWKEGREDLWRLQTSSKYLIALYHSNKWRSDPWIDVIVTYYSYLRS